MALLGSNGAGKTTVARVATGLIAPAGGTVLVDGDDLTGAPPYRFARAGVAHAPEGRSVFATLTVEENLSPLVPPVEGSVGGARRARRRLRAVPRPGERRRQLAGTLSGGEQRMLSMARVLVEAPRAAGRRRAVARPGADHRRRGLRTWPGSGQQGTALLIVEQHVAHALDLCDRVVLLDHGTVRWHGPAADAGQHVVAEMFEHH